MGPEKISNFWIKKRNLETTYIQLQKGLWFDPHSWLIEILVMYKRGIDQKRIKAKRKELFKNAISVPSCSFGISSWTLIEVKELQIGTALGWDYGCFTFCIYWSSYP